MKLLLFGIQLLTTVAIATFGIVNYACDSDNNPAPRATPVRQACMRILISPVPVSTATAPDCAP